MQRLIPLYILEKYQKGELSGHFNGFAIFTDISGFTAITQTLMQSGKEGAEVLSSIINGVFSPAIDSIYKYKGFVSSFAGDAFTAVFDTDDVQLPLKAAFEISEIFSEKTVIKTRLGDFELASRIGISHGCIEYAIIDAGIQKTYYFMGEAIDRCAKSQQYAGKNQVLTDAEFLKKLPPHIKFCEAEPGFFRVKSNPQVLPVSVPINHRELPVELCRDFIHIPVLDNINKGEFRDIVSCFIGFSQQDDFKDAVSIVIRKCYEYGGYFNRVDFGDKGGTMLVIFGAPSGYEKLYQRAADFSLSLKDIPDFRFKAGISAGTAYTGFIGSGFRSEYSALGSVVNLSARIMMDTEFQEINSEPFFARSVSGMFHMQSSGLRQFKGFSKEVEVFRLETRKEHSSKIEYKGMYAGRISESQKLAKFLEPLKKGKSAGIIYIEGSAGIGKTRFLDNFTKKHTEFSYFYMPCDEILGKSHNPFIYFFNRYFNQKPGSSARQNKESFLSIYKKMLNNVRDESLNKELSRTQSIIAALIGIEWEGSLYSSLDPKSRYENTIYAVKDFIKAHSLQKPVAIIFDDAHWIDTDSLSLLNEFIRNIIEFPIAVLLLCRFMDTGQSYNLLPGKAFHIELKPLQKESMMNIIQDILKTQSIPEKTLGYISEKSGGNPFFAEQISLFMVENRIFDNNFNITGTLESIPAEIKQVIIARIDRLSFKLKEVVKTASVLGREFAVMVLRELLSLKNISKNDKEIKSYMKKGVKEQIWEFVSELTCIFKHILIRDAVYDIQLKDSLRKLHNLAGGIIESIYQENLAPHYEELAEHYMRAENRGKSIIYLEKSAMISTDNFKNENAVKFYDRLLKLLDESEDMEKYTEVLLKKGEIFHLTGRWNEARDIFMHVNALASNGKDESMVIKAKIALGQILIKQGNSREAFIMLEQALNRAEKSRNKDLVPNILHSIGYYHFRHSRFVKALEYYNRSLQKYREADNVQGVTSVLCGIGNVFHHQHRYKRALEYYEELLDNSRKSNNKRYIGVALGNIANVHHSLGDDYNITLDYHFKSLAIAQETGDREEISRAMGNIGQVYDEQGLHKKALAYYKMKLAICQELENILEICSVNGLIGDLYSNSGKYREAEKYYKYQLKIGKKLGNSVQVCRAYCGLGVLYSNQGRFSKAMEAYNRLRDLGYEIQDVYIMGISHINMGQLDYETGDFEKGMKHYSKARRLLKKVDNKEGIATAFFGMAQISHALGLHDKALRYYNKAISISRDLSNRHILVIHYYNKAELLYKVGKTKQSARLGDEALKISEHIGWEEGTENLLILKYKIEKDTQGLEKMLEKKDQNPENTAVINYELFRINRQDKCRKKALRIFTRLYKSAPKFQYLKMMNELNWESSIS